MLLITGATGNVGTELVPLLLEKRQDIRLMVRDTDRASQYAKQTEVVAADLEKLDTLDVAFKGVDGLFLLVSDRGMTQTDNALAAAKKHGIQHIVYLSSTGAGMDPPLAMDKHHLTGEMQLQASGISWTILRSSFMMSNCLMWAETINSEATVHDGFGDGIMPAIDPRDVAEVAAEALLHPHQHADTSYELTGLERLTTPMMVTTLSKLLGKDLTYVDHSPEEMAAMMLETGMPESFVRMLQESMERTRRNESVVITDDFKAITGRAPRTFEQWATAHKDFFK